MDSADGLGGVVASDDELGLVASDLINGLIASDRSIAVVIFLSP